MTQPPEKSRGAQTTRPQKLVYIIEDDPALASHFARTLSSHRTETFTNGIDAIKRIDKQLPDAILLDIILDGPSGFSLLHELQSYTDTARIPIVICSSIDLTDHDLASYGVTHILDKTTMHPTDLIEVVNSISERRGAVGRADSFRAPHVEGRHGFPSKAEQKRSAPHA